MLYIRDLINLFIMNASIRHENVTLRRILFLPATIITRRKTPRATLLLNGKQSSSRKEGKVCGKHYFASMDISVLAAVGSFAVSERILKPKATILVILGCILAYDLTTKTHDVSSLRVYRGEFIN